MAMPTSTAGRFQRFLGAISPATADTSAAVRRAENVAKSLHSLFYPLTVFNGATMQSIGSVAKQTAVLPVGDVDVVFKIPSATWLQYQQYSGNGQSALLQRVRGRLQETYPNTTIRGDGPVVKILFQSGHYVEVVPGFQSTQSSKLFVPQTTNGGRWAFADYDAEIAAIRTSDAASNGQTRRLIKMVKMWKSYCSVPIKSLAIELRAIYFLDKWRYRGCSQTYDDFMIRDFFAELITKVNATAVIPGIDEKCHYGDAWLAKAKSAHANAVSACGYETSNDNTTACYVWRQIFGEKFGY